MMQDGLHIGLAAWINVQRNTGSFAVYPDSPIPAALADLDSVKDTSDLAKAAEFARLVNFVPRQGEVADVFSASTVLWEVHWDILGRMDFATEPWTTAERAQYQAARDTLYTTDSAGRPAPSEKLLLYEEMKSAYQDLQDGGGSATEIAQALANWMVLGFKQAVEDALEVIVRLSGRSSRNLAQNERASLEPERLLLRGDLSFAPTYFAPISALARETWMEAKVSFKDLDDTVGNSPVSGKWKAYLANRVGDVSFDYIVLRCLRPWYTLALYRADDWRFSAGGMSVSKGNGSEGLMPAYVDAVYLVSVKDVTIKPNWPRTPPIFLPPRAAALALAERPSVSRPILQAKSLGDPGPSTGGVGKAVNTPLAISAVSTSIGSLSAPEPNRLLTAPTPASQFTRARVGELRRVTAVDVNQRYMRAQMFLAGTAQPPPPAAEERQIYVAGFGCEKIPFSPNPNVNYRWS
jgi:hypothetical protein